MHVIKHKSVQDLVRFVERYFQETLCVKVNLFCCDGSRVIPFYCDFLLTFLV